MTFLQLIKETADNNATDIKKFSKIVSGVCFYLLML